MADTASIEIKNAGSAVHNDAPASSSTSEPSTGSFVHTPLEDPRRSIRLVTFDKPSQHGTLCFRLEHHALTPSLVYNALSYEWGTPENQKTVFIEGRPFLLYDNLHAFLFQLQSLGTRTTPLFADAICIDQSNLVERNMQVQMMGKIYEQAKTVLVWLGPAADNSDFVFDVCNSEGQFNFEDIAQSDEENRLYPADYYPSLNTVEAARSLDAVFLRTYWNRLWIIQEMYVAREVELLCGTRTTTWETFNRLWVAAGAILPENGIIAEPGEESDARKHLRSLSSSR